ncbi:alpha/beta-hydrolase [Gloeopeniophorella convolvens]|nr:alpha/beta-hydrolase [Gloeopeniophorella convolvens]
MPSIRALLGLATVASGLAACTTTSEDGTVGKPPFAPAEYAKKVVTCPAINRTENKEVDINIHYVDVNPTAERTLLLLHGWPSLWASWKYQIQEFEEEYRIIAPDLRGFGASTHPGDVKSSGTMPDLVGDLLCILKAAEIPKVIAIGHDWGTQLAYEAARERPDVFTAVVGITIPVSPGSGPFVPVRDLVSALPRLAYQQFFDGSTPDAVEELGRDVRRTLRGTLRDVASPPPGAFLTSTKSFMGAWDSVEEIPPISFFSREEEDYWVEQYEIQKFAYNLQFYTDENRLASWKFANDQGNHTIPQPVLSIFPQDDPVANWELAAKMLHSFDFLPNSTLRTLPGAHWVQLENPAGVNAIIRKWLADLYAKQEHLHDEL